VTARHVLSHSTGFPNWRQRPEPLIPAFAPGERFGYSGEGFYLLQRVVERVTGLPVERVLHEQVFGPLGMTRTGTLWRPSFGDAVAAGAQPNGAFGYSPRGDAERLTAAEGALGKPAHAWTADDALRALALVRPEAPAVPNHVLPNVAGSLVTTAADYARFLAASLAPRGPHALDARLGAEMLTPQNRLNARLGWGLGWGIERDRGRTYAWHWGDNGVFKNFVLHEPERGRGVVVFTNSARGAKVYDRAIRAASRRDPAGLLYWMVG
jgi:CubicO group peptidase (beta-lactamase class C family)